jgi:S1-C subfamily serine protease
VEQTAQSTQTSDSDTGTTPVIDENLYTSVYEDVADAVASVSVYTGSRQPTQGSGFMIDETHMVTNQHVVADSTDLYVRFADTDWGDASVLGTDIYSDLAVLTVDTTPDSMSPLSFSEARPSVGNRAVAIGNPFGLSGSVSAGIVSGTNRNLRGANNFSIAAGIQTDAAVNPGNSGGPLVDLDGNVLGVINSGGGDNVGFAISGQLAQRVIPALIEDGAYEHPFIGIRLNGVSPLVAEANDLEDASGIYVHDTFEGGPSDGILQGSTGTEIINGAEINTGGDVIRAVDGTPIPTRQAFGAYLALETSPGETINVTVERDGSETTVAVTLGTRPDPT